MEESELLRAVEALAVRAGYESLTLYAKPLDEGISTPELVEWYQQNGYSIVEPGEKPRM